MLTALALLAPMALTPIVELPAMKDNTMYSEGGIDTPIANGAGQYFFAGSNLNGFLRRALIAFDPSSIPAGSTILTARLSLSMSRSLAGPATVSIHRCLVPWGEGMSDAAIEEGGGTAAQVGDASWFHSMFPTDLWTTPGGDFFPSPSAAAEIAFIGVYEFTSPTLAADVQAWLDCPAGNFGWILVGDESAPQTTKRFDTRENPIPENHPRLIVEFLPPACPGDVNGDRMVGLSDIAEIINCWAEPASCNLAADLDSSGSIGLGDLAVVVTYWATSCPF